LAYNVLYEKLYVKKNVPNIEFIYLFKTKIEFIYQTVILGFGICMPKKQTDKQSGLFNSLGILSMIHFQINYLQESSSFSCF